MGEPENPNFYDFGISERVPETQDQLLLSLETPESSKESKNKPKIIFREDYFGKSHKYGNPTFREILDKTDTNKYRQSV